MEDRAADADTVSKPGQKPDSRHHGGEQQDISQGAGKPRRMQNSSKCVSASYDGENLTRDPYERRVI